MDLLVRKNMINHVKMVDYQQNQWKPFVNFCVV